MSIYTDYTDYADHHMIPREPEGDGWTDDSEDADQ